jgi:hypothetical protein
MEHILQAEREGAERERVGSEVLALREELIDLDRRRQANREALVWLKKREGDGEGVVEKEWYLLGDLFLCLPSSVARQTLQDERAFLEEETQRKSALLKTKMRQLAAVEGQPDPIKDFDLRPMNAKVHSRT